MNKSNYAAFDGTIKKYPTNYTNKIIFYRKNIFTEELLLNKMPLPIHNLDFKNNLNYNDYNLNFPPFTN